MNDLTVIQDEIYAVRDTFVSVLTDKSLNFEKEAGFAIQSLSANDYAMGVAMRNRQSVINAVTNIAAIGISLNPAKKQAYLVPRDGKICLDISYMGLMDLAIQSGSIMWGQAEIVYQQDSFELMGFDKPPRHGRNPFSKDRGVIVGAYVVVKTATGDYLTTCMQIDEIYDIRDRSSAWKAWVEKKKRCPWVTDEGEMIKKTVIKRAYKLWPKTERFERVETAIDFLNRESGEGLAELVPTSDTANIGVIKPTHGSMESLSTELQNYLRELAGETEAIFRNPEAGASVCYDRIEIEGFDPECKTAFWSLLPSDMRSALKKEGEYRRQQQKEKAA